MNSLRACRSAVEICTRIVRHGCVYTEHRLPFPVRGSSTLRGSNMKTVGIYAGCGTFAFLLMGYQLGIFEPDREQAETQPAPQAEAREKPAPFPDALAGACRGQPVAKAAAYTPGDRPHRAVFLKSSGTLDKWQERL